MRTRYSSCMLQLAIFSFLLGSSQFHSILVDARTLSGYGVPIELFAPFTDSCVIVMKRLIGDVAKDVSRPRTEWNSLNLVYIFLVMHPRCVTLQRLPRVSMSTILLPCLVCSTLQSCASTLLPVISGVLEIAFAFVKLYVVICCHVPFWLTCGLVELSNPKHWIATKL